MEYFIYMTNDCNLMCEYCSVLLDCEKNKLPIKPTYTFENLIEFIKRTQERTNDNEISIYFFVCKLFLKLFFQNYILPTNPLKNKNVFLAKKADFWFFS